MTWTWRRLACGPCSAPLGHCVERGYREAISQALFEYVTATRGLALYLQA